jgi:hydrogenase-4 component B
LQSINLPDVLVKIVMSVSIAVLALTGALAVATAVRFFGTTFLARDRSNRTEKVHESPKAMLWGMAFLAALCVVLGLLSFWLIPYIDNVTSSILGVSIESKVVDGFTISPGSSDFATMAPVLIALLGMMVAGLAWFASRAINGKETVRKAGTWDCGTPLTSRNQYSGTALSNPIIRVFSNIYRPQTEMRTEFTSSPYIKKRMMFQLRFVEVFERYLYRPIINFFVGVSKRLTVIQAGSIQAYLAYIFIMLVLLLVAFR